MWVLENAIYGLYVMSSFSTISVEVGTRLKYARNTLEAWMIPGPISEDVGLPEAHARVLHHAWSACLLPRLVLLGFFFPCQGMPCLAL